MRSQLDLSFNTSRMVAGVDEAGRGPLAGPVVAGAVILDPDKPINGLADSKILSPERREELAELIKSRALAWAIGHADVNEIDQINILQATMLAMRRAVLALRPGPEYVYVDGNRCPILPCPAEPVIRGDALIPAISAASILAKVSRDKEMQELDILYPGYGLAVHKGYPTVQHVAALQRLGVSPIHRRSFGPVKKCLLAVAEQTQTE